MRWYDTWFSVPCSFQLRFIQVVTRCSLVDIWRVKHYRLEGFPKKIPEHYDHPAAIQNINMFYGLRELSNSFKTHWQI